MEYTATVIHSGGRSEAVRVTASDYTEAYLMITYALPLTSYIVTLEKYLNHPSRKGKRNGLKNKSTKIDRCKNFTFTSDAIVFYL